MKEIIDDLNNALTKKEVHIILFHLLDGYTFKEIANKLEGNESTVKTTYYRALKKYEKRRAL